MKQRGLTPFSDLGIENTIWSVAEVGMSTVAACLPTFGPLYKNVRSVGSLMKSFQSLFSLQSIFSKTRGSGNAAINSHVEQESRGSRSGWLRLHSYGGHKTSTSYDPDVEMDRTREVQQMPSGALVQKTVESRADIVEIKG